MTERCFANVKIKSWIGQHAEPGFRKFFDKQSVETVDTDLFWEPLLQCVNTQHSMPGEGYAASCISDYWANLGISTSRNCSMR